MAQPQDTPEPSPTAEEEALTILLCLLDDAYTIGSTPRGAPLRLAQAPLGLGGPDDPRALPAAAQRRVLPLFPARCRKVPRAPVPGLGRALALLVAPPAAVKLRRFLEPLRRAVLPELVVGDPETLIVDSTLLAVLRPHQVKQSSGRRAALRPGPLGSGGAPSPSTGSSCTSFCAPRTARAGFLRADDACERGRGAPGRGVARRGVVPGGRGGPRVARGPRLYRSEALAGALGPSAASSRAGNREGRPAGPEAAHIEVCFATLKRDFGLEGTLAKTLVGLATRIAAKIAAYTYGCYITTVCWDARRAASRICGRRDSATDI